MAKGQVRTNKEKKKPKQDKSQVKAPVTGGIVSPSQITPPKARTN